MIVKKRFYKENGLWYIDLPEFLEAGLGQRNNLLMVDGADKLLDILSGNTNEVYVEFGNEEMEGYTHTLTKFLIGLNRKLLEDIGHAPVDYGAYYMVEELSPMRIWLCPVTMYVFNGIYPEKIFLKTVTDIG